uniref:Uncharacterized protein n=1 Tax=Trichogramma kaykai TaxID=54128 RepID=A0ABD2WVE7_9HYME
MYQHLSYPLFRRYEKYSDIRNLRAQRSRASPDIIFIAVPLTCSNIRYAPLRGAPSIDYEPPQPPYTIHPCVRPRCRRFRGCNNRPTQDEHINEIMQHRRALKGELRCARSCARYTFSPCAPYAFQEQQQQQLEFRRATLSARRKRAKPASEDVSYTVPERSMRKFSMRVLSKSLSVARNDRCARSTRSANRVKFRLRKTGPRDEPLCKYTRVRTEKIIVLAHFRTTPLLPNASTSSSVVVVLLALPLCLG